jgi:hypothetical protein
MLEPYSTRGARGRIGAQSRDRTRQVFESLLSSWQCHFLDQGSTLQLAYEKNHAHSIIPATECAVVGATMFYATKLAGTMSVPLILGLPQNLSPGLAARYSASE